MSSPSSPLFKLNKLLCAFLPQVTFHFKTNSHCFSKAGNQYIQKNKNQSFISRIPF